MTHTPYEPPDSIRAAHARHVEQVRADTDRFLGEIADLLREKNIFRAGWHRLDDVQKADAAETFLREVERMSMSHIEGRHIDRDEYDALSPREDA